MKYLYLIILIIFSFKISGQECVEPRPNVLEVNLSNNDQLIISKNGIKKNNETLLSSIPNNASILINKNGSKNGRVVISYGTYSNVDILGSCKEIIITSKARSGGGGGIASTPAEPTWISNSNIQFKSKLLELHGDVTITDGSRITLFDSDNSGTNSMTKVYNGNNVQSKIRVIKNSYLNIQTSNDLNFFDGFYQVGEVGLRYNSSTYWNPFDYSCVYFRAPKINIDAGNIGGGNTTRFFRGSKSHLGFYASSGGQVDVDTDDSEWNSVPSPWEKDWLVMSEGLERGKYGADSQWCSVLLNANDTGWSIGGFFGIGISKDGIEGVEISPTDVVGILYDAGTVSIGVSGDEGEAVYHDEDLNDCLSSNRILRNPYPFNYTSSSFRNYSCSNLPGANNPEAEFLCDEFSDIRNIYVQKCGSSGCPGYAKVSDGQNDTNLDVDQIEIDPFEDLYNKQYPIGLFKISPNPSSGYAQILISLNVEQAITVNIIDLSGRQILSKDLGRLSPQIGESIDLNISDLNVTNGTYLVQVIGENFRETKKLIVLR